jgi:hypothetical protein
VVVLCIDFLSGSREKFVRTGSSRFNEMASPLPQASSSQFQVKRQRTADMDKELFDDTNNRAKRLRPSDLSLDEIQHVAALLEADDGGDRDDAMDLQPPSPQPLDKGKQRMIEESSTGSAASGHIACDHSRNAKVVGELEAELR